MSIIACSVDDCEKPVVARGLCRKHYVRWSRHGDPAIVKVIRGATCGVQDCERSATGQGFCNLHYKRLRRNGDPSATVRAASHGGETYRSIHRLVQKLHGSARLHICVKCGDPASDWAYDHADPRESYDHRGRPFSGDPNRYMPLCRQCHCIFDQIGVKR